MDWHGRDDWSVRLVASVDPAERLHIIVDAPGEDSSLTRCGESAAFWRDCTDMRDLALGDLCPDCAAGLAELAGTRGGASR